eukprot:8766089-Prorocentrum_lima.AAC.1
MILANTWFRKPQSKLITFHEPGRDDSSQLIRGNFEVLDYMLIHHRWKNCLLDIEADHNHPINTDHYPLRFRLRLQLAARKRPDTHLTGRLKLTDIPHDKEAEYDQLAVEAFKEYREGSVTMQQLSDKLMTWLRENTPTIKVERNRPE